LRIENHELDDALVDALEKVSPVNSVIHVIGQQMTKAIITENESDRELVFHTLSLFLSLSYTLFIGLSMPFSSKNLFCCKSLVDKSLRRTGAAGLSAKSYASRL
jgi:hypothetical protein